MPGGTGETEHSSGVLNPEKLPDTQQPGLLPSQGLGCLGLELRGQRSLGLQCDPETCSFGDLYKSITYGAQSPYLWNGHGGRHEKWPP